MGPLSRFSEQEIERVLAGDTVPAEEGPDEVSRFVRDLKSTYTANPSPAVEASHLNAIMDAVRSAAQDGESLAPALPAEKTRILPWLSRWRRVALSHAGVALGLKVLGGAVALAGTAGGLASLDALPDPAQRPVATAVEAVTPFELPGNEAKPEKQDPGTLKIEEVPPAEHPPAPSPDPNSEFGKDVAEEAKTGGVEGPEISERARERRERREQGDRKRPALDRPPADQQVPGPPPGAGPPVEGETRKGGPQNGLGRANGAAAGQPRPEQRPPGSPAEVSSVR